MNEIISVIYYDLYDENFRYYLQFGLLYKILLRVSVHEAKIINPYDVLVMIANLKRLNKVYETD